MYLWRFILCQPRWITVKHMKTDDFLSWLSHAALVMVCTALLLTSPMLQAHTEQPLEIGFRERLLVLAPHPDDETLSAAGLIRQVFEHGGTVRTVVVTAGDAYVEAIQRDLGKRQLTKTDFLNYGEKRLAESRSAAKVLGNGFIHLDLYGFSDGAIYPMLVSHWGRAHPDRSGFTGYSHVPYVEAEDKGIAQEGELLRNELVNILRATKPTMIVFPDVMENDSDHAGLGMFALLAVNDWLEHTTGEEPSPRLLAYLIHWQHDWPPGSDADQPLDLSNQPLFLPDDLPLRGHKRACINLSVQDRHLKREALAQYHTQQRAMGAFLSAFVHSNECFTELNASDSKGIDNVVRQWQHVRKAFDSHPISRRKIWQLY